MITETKKRNLIAVTMTLDPTDVDLLDRLAKLEGETRSAEMRGILLELRPMLTVTVEALEKVFRQREEFGKKLATVAIGDLEALLPEVENLSRQYLGALSRIEGATAAGLAPASNTGATLDENR